MEGLSSRSARRADLINGLFALPIVRLTVEMQSLQTSALGSI